MFGCDNDEKRKFAAQYGLRMTITLSVRAALQVPRLILIDRLVVHGILLVSQKEFMLFQSDGVEELDESLSIRIDDPVASEMIQRAFPAPSTGAWSYFGPATVDGQARSDLQEIVLHMTTQIWLDQPGDGQSKRIEVRDSPYFR